MAKKLDSDGRLKRFLEAGYLPEELPPPFVSATFARYRKSLLAAWTQPGINLENYKSTPEPFGVPKFGHARRRVVIVNPINQFRVAKLISDHWDDIAKFLKRSNITEFRPIIDMLGGPCNIWN